MKRTTFYERLRFLITGRKESPVGYLQVRNKTGRAQFTPREYAAFAREGFQQNPYVFRAIQLRGAAIGGLKWMAVKKQKTRRARVDEIEGHPIVDLLKRPNPFQGQAQFFESLESFLLIAGNAYIAPSSPVTGDNAGKPRELWTLRPDRMQIVAGSGPMAPIGGYEYRVDGGEPRKFDVGEIMHLRRFHPTDDFYGMSPLEPGGRSADMNNAGRVHNTALLQNGAQPSGALMFKGGAHGGSLTDEQRDAIRKQLNDDHVGPENAGSIFVFENDATWEQMSLSPKDMNWQESMRQSARETCSVLGVPPEMVGDSANRTYANYEEARRSFWTDTIIPEADFLRDELNTFLAPRFGDGITLEYDRDAIEALRPDRAKLWAFVDAAYLAGTITLNESRTEKGYDDTEGGDVFVTPLTVRSAGESGAPPDHPQDGATPPEPDEPSDDAPDEENADGT